MTTMDIPEPQAIMQVEADAPEVETSTDLDGLGLSVNDATREAWNALSEVMSQEDDIEAVASTVDLEPGADLKTLNTVLGAGMGEFLGEEEGGPPGSACVVLFVAEPMTTQMAIDYVATAYNVDALAAEDAYVRLVHTGPIDLLSHRFRMTPTPSGVSIGHRDSTAGTLGCLCIGKSEPRDRRLLVLSNNHVLANVNAGTAGDPVFQPGPYDSGTPGANRIGILERFVPIHFGGQNYVDCATAWVDPDNVRSDFVYVKQGTHQYFNVSLPTVPARIGMTVGKSGRTTQLTAGRVDAIAVSIRVNMGGGRVARFDDQISISGVTGNFSRGGDSGSLAWTWDKMRNPVGLLFAGGGGYTFANPISTVLTALDVDLVVDGVNQHEKRQVT